MTCPACFYGSKVFVRENPYGFGNWFWVGMMMAQMM